MDDSRPTPDYSAPLLAVLATAAMYFFSTGLDGLRPLVWIAPIPVLYVAMQSTRRMAWIIAFVAYLLGGLNLAGYLTRIAPIGVVLASIILPAFAFSLVVVACRDAILHLRHPLAFLAFPIGWTAYEYVLFLSSPHGTAGSIAYTQADFLLFIQLASLTGIQGLTFVLTLVPAGIAAALRARDRKGRLIPIVVVSIILAAALEFGLTRIATRSQLPPVRVGLVSVDSSCAYIDSGDRESTQRVLEVYAGRATELARAGATIVLFPEKIFRVTDSTRQELYDALGAMARRDTLFVVTGINSDVSPQRRNIAAAFTPDAKLVAEYDKAYPLPGLESGYRRGQSIVRVSITGLSAGLAICKDMDFPVWIRQYGAAGTGILFVPAWDFTSDAWLHSRMAVLRAVENGFALVRAANNGFMTITDDKGRVIAERESSMSAAVILLGDVRPGTGSTFYSTTGDWFAWLNLFCLVILLILVSIRLVQRRSGKAAPDA